MRLCFDIDFIIFAAASVMEEDFIVVKSEKHGIVKEFPTRTAFYGHWKKKEGGWLAGQTNLAGEKLYKVEDFIIEDGKRLREFRIKSQDDGPDTFLSPLKGAKKLIDDQIASLCKTLGADTYFGFTGRGEVFRHKVATLLPYKGQRSEVKPLLLEQLKDYVIDRHNITLVTEQEADDHVNMAVLAGYKEWLKYGKDDSYKVCGIEVDKDSKQCDGFHHNPNRDAVGVMREISGFGGLWLDEKGDVDGCGRMWLYYQIAAGDVADNYKPNCFSDVKYGDKGAYNDLKDATTDKEAFTELVAIFKRLYPEAKTVEGCKGPVKIDAMYVMQEMAVLALMLRKPGDTIDVKAVCDKLGVSYEDA